MDVKRNKSSKNTPKWQKALIIAAVCLGVLSYWKMSNNESTSLRMSDILLSKVRKGDLAVEVTGYGSLQSKVQQLITTQTPATIEKIILKPGAVVTPDKVIMILNNPELNQEVEKTRLELAQVKANLRKLRSNQKRELLNEKENFQLY